jgi:hypothetical protein
LKDSVLLVPDHPHCGVELEQRQDDSLELFLVYAAKFGFYHCAAAIQDDRVR